MQKVWTVPSNVVDKVEISRTSRLVRNMSVLIVLGRVLINLGNLRPSLVG